jgi:hypothetical protein
MRRRQRNHLLDEGIDQYLRPIDSAPNSVAQSNRKHEDVQ